MASIRANCHNCGDVEITNSDVTLMAAPAQECGSYRFKCPTCKTIVFKEAPARIMNLLVATGVELVLVKPPVMEIPVDAPPLDDDDLIDLGLALLEDGLVEQELEKLLAGE